MRAVLVVLGAAAPGSPISPGGVDIVENAAWDRDGVVDPIGNQRPGGSLPVRRRDDPPRGPAARFGRGAAPASASLARTEPAVASRYGDPSVRPRFRGGRSSPRAPLGVKERGAAEIGRDRAAPSISDGTSTSTLPEDT
jgi:hypothetical protein